MTSPPGSEKRRGSGGRVVIASSMMLVLGLLLWARLIVVRDLPRTAIADEEALHATRPYVTPQPDKTAPHVVDGGLVGTLNRDPFSPCSRPSPASQTSANRSPPTPHAVGSRKPSAALTAMDWLYRRPTPTAYSATLEEAIAWSMERLDEVGVARPDLSAGTVFHDATSRP